MQALYQWQITGQAFADIEAQFVASPEARGVDLDYFRRLLSIVAEHSDGLQDIIARHADRPIEQLDPVERGILLLGLGELQFVREVPYRVVINEALELARAFGAEDGHKYVNALLDKAAGELRDGERSGAARPR